jgi:hypothetical protein
MDIVKKLSLFVDYVCDISEELVQLGHALLDVSDLSFTLYNQGVLKVHLVLRGKSKLLLRLLLPIRIASLCPRRLLLLQCRSSSRCR